MRYWENEQGWTQKDEDWLNYLLTIEHGNYTTWSYINELVERRNLYKSIQGKDFLKDKVKEVN